MITSNPLGLEVADSSTFTVGCEVLSTSKWSLSLVSQSFQLSGSANTMVISYVSPPEINIMKTNLLLINC